MASKKQSEFGLPTASDTTRNSARFLPRFFRSQANLKFLQATVDQLTQPGTAEKLTSFVGRRIAKGYSATDNYISEVNKDRQDYQLEPALVIKDSFDNVTFYKDYNDYINTLKYFNVDVRNHDKINQQESYPWNPNIDWDKFTNFREYYWLPEGPLSVPVQGQARSIESTLTVTLQEADGDFSYVFNGKSAPNPSLRLYRGQTYRFEIDTPGHPFAIAITRSFTPGNAIIVAGKDGIRQDGVFDGALYGEVYDTGDWLVLPETGSVTFEEDDNISTLYPDGQRFIGEAGEDFANIYVENGVIEFTVPFNAPDKLFYISQTDINVSGLFKVYDVEENSFIDVEEEILGKKYYTSSNGIEFTNGLKIRFRGFTEPALYQEDEYYVEGVGDKIKLIPKENLTLPQKYYRDKLEEFDDAGFDEKAFGASKSYQLAKDYLLINRASPDLNSWSRSNRWFHRDVIEKSYLYNRLDLDLNDSAKAKRPIIEFEPGLKLWKYGTKAKKNVDLVDVFTKDVFSTIEGTLGYNIDGVELIEGMRVLFTADTDILVNGRIYEVKFVYVDNANRITLVETDDSLPQTNETVLATSGIEYAGTIFYYDGESWYKAQEKTDINQAPLFDLCCPQGNTYTDQSIFDSTSFRGCKVFSYKQGTGANDPELGFPLSYRNINNTGDIVFNFDLLTDTINIQQGEETVTVGTDTAFLRAYTDRTEFEYRNGWASESVRTRQKVLRQYVAASNQRTQFEIDVYNRAGLIDDLTVSVTVNNKLRTDYSVQSAGDRAFVVFVTPLNIGDVVIIKTVSQSAKNNRGLYEIPYSLERNPLNQNVADFTLGEVIDHVDSMIEDIPNYAGDFLGSSNLRDLGDLDRYGKRFLKHAMPLNLSIFSLASKEYNLVNAIEYSKDEYSKFKRNFVQTATNLGIDTNTIAHVNLILEEVNKQKTPTQPFYFSDMLGYKTSNVLNYEVIDANNPYYNLSEIFNLASLNNQAVYVYLNSKQLIFDKDYYFTDEGFVYIQAGQEIGDEIQIVEYSSTDGSYIPPTPTKLGIYPRYEPEITIDEAWLDNANNSFDARVPYAVYAENTNNHLQKGWFYPCYLDKKTAQQDDVNESVIKLQFKGSSKIFYAPASKLSAGTTRPSEEYAEFPIGQSFIVGHDGSMTKCYKDYRDMLLLELENRIYNNIKIDHNKTQINIHNYVGGRFRDTDISDQEINRILIKDFSNWISIANIDYTANTFFQNQNQFSYNYRNATSAANGLGLPGYWRAVYKDAFDTDRPHTHPWEMLGFTIKPNWWDEVYGPAPYTSNNSILWRDLEYGIVREPNKTLRIIDNYARPGLTDFIPVDEQGQLKPPVSANYAKNIISRTLDDSFEFGDQAPVENAWRKSSEYPFSLIKALLLNRPADFLSKAFDTSRVKRNLAGQVIYSETGKNIELDQIVFPNTYADNARIPTSGLINYIYNLIGSNVLSVYEDYKNSVKSIRNQLGFKLGGYSDKSKIKLLLQSKSPSEESAQGLFVPEENYQVFLNTSSPIDNVSYSGVIIEVRPDGYIIQGYDNQTPIFKYYKASEKQNDPTVIAGAESADVVQWSPQKLYVKGQIVENNFSYYRVVSDFTSGTVFAEDNLAKLSELPTTGGQRAQFRNTFDKNFIRELSYGSKLKTVQEVVDFLLGYGEYLKDKGFTFNYFSQEYQKVEDWKTAAKEFLFWSSQGWATGTVISLSPSAYEISFQRDYAVVDDIFDDFYNYSLVAENGKPLEKRFSNILREGNSFNLAVENTDNGIYNLVLPLVQKEHVVLISNQTIFDDVIYQPYSGYRQERIKVLGYRSDNWDASLNIPGFIYDDAQVTEWEPWQDYQIGNLVRYKEYYYVAIEPVNGSAEFNFNLWQRLADKPEAQLISNFDYRANQFTDFYDVDTVGFDNDQNKLAQHLIGYQKRDYLANIINDDVSQVKFYQGFIQDKGTRNAIDKLFDALGDDAESLDFYEEWAIKSGSYGDTDKIKQLGIPLKADKLLETPQGIELLDYIPNNRLDTTYMVRPADLVSKPEDFSVNCFSTKVLNEYILTGGYVNEDDIDYKVESIEELEAVDNNLLNLGEYIWVTDISPNNWNVYRIKDANISVNDFTVSTGANSQGQFTATVSYTQTGDKEIEIGDVLSINDAQLYNVTGFYKIIDIMSATTLTLEIPEENDFQDFTEESFSCFTLNSERIANFDNFNLVAGRSTLTNQKIWIDSFASQDEWAVLENTRVYNNPLVQLNPNDIDDSSAIVDESQEFAKDISATFDNKLIFATAPGVEDGEVYFYRRNQDSSDLILNETINNPGFGLYELATSRFGESISVSSDGEYVAIGAPGAGKIKNKYQGSWSPTSEYNKNDIVNYKGSLWRTRRTVLAQNTAREYSTFDSYVLMNDRKADSSSLTTLLTGSPLLENQQVNHILVRAPADQYTASSVGDFLRLKWNQFTYLNGDIDSPVYPWNNTIPEIGFNPATGTNFVDGFHEIQEKVDIVVYIEDFDTNVNVGDTVQTTSGFANVAYVDTKLGDMVLYLNDTKGNFASQGTLELLDIDDAVVTIVGEYTELDYGFVEDFNGWWAIKLNAQDINTNPQRPLELDLLGTNYVNGTVFFEEGKGLVIVDLLTTIDYAMQSNRLRNFYLNIDDEIKRLGNVTTNNFIPSMLHNLNDKWIARITPDVKNYLNIDPVTGEYDHQIGFYVFDGVTSPYYDQVLDAGFEFSDLNQTQHQLADIWDGYIDVVLQETDPNTRNLFQFAIGDRVKDRQRPFNIFQQPAPVPINTGNEAEVVYVESNINGRFDIQRIYIKIISGNWQLEDNIALTEITRGRTESGSFVERPMGRINDYNNDVIVPNDEVGVGPFIVVESSNLTDNELFVLENIEYYVNCEVRDEIGATLPPSIPGTLNRDYEQVFNISANSGGEESLDEVGAVIILRRSGPNFYSLLNVITSEQNFNLSGNNFGKQVKIIQHSAGYVLYVSSNGDLDNDNPGCIEIYEHGPIDPNNYRGTWNPDLSYSKNDVVLYLGNYFIARINIAERSQTSIFNTNFWTNISWRRSADINYRGYWEANEYAIDSIVLFEGSLYRALTNIRAENANPVNDTDRWIKLENNVEYAGFIPNTRENQLDSEVYNVENIINFADKFVVSRDGEVIVTKSQTQNTVELLIFRKTLSGRYAQQTDKIVLDQDLDGLDFDIDLAGENIAVSFPTNSDQETTGKVIVYRLSDFRETVLYAPENQNISNFGYSVAFNATGLGIACANIDNFEGRILVYEVLQDQFIISESLSYDISDVDLSQKVFGMNSHFYVGLPNGANNEFAGQFLDFRKEFNTTSWTVIRELLRPVDLDKIRGVFLYNKETEQKLTFLDYIDPIQGKIAGPAEQNISYKVPYDPAFYNVGNNATDVNWAEEKVGKLWWNTGNARFTYPYQGDINYQRANWNELQPGATVDVYEWVESDLLPSSWDSITNTGKGIELGVTGVTLYGNDQYSKKFVFDRESQTFVEKYYYWVKNKRTLPNQEGRTISALDVARLIAQPREQGYRFVSFLSDNRLVLNNCKSLIQGDNVVLNVDYVTDDTPDQSSHTIYQIITDGISTSVPNTDIELKWFDSLIGEDLNGKPVPDINLADRQKYGVQSRPRQSMFKNRFEALKQFIDRCNNVLSANLIVEDKDISNLFKVDEIPGVRSGLYDLVVDSKADLLLLGTKVQRAVIEPIVVNGKISRINIVNRGRGYKVPPSVTITGSGIDAQIQFELNNLGQITTAEVLSTGENYGQDTRIIVRPFSVLVTNDEDTQNRWAIYSYDATNNNWDRVKTQGYDVTRYWQYKDWYQVGYNALTEVNYFIDAQYQLNSINDSIGDTIKIANVGSGGWLLLRKVNNSIDNNFTTDYEVVGRQNGTIHFSKGLYDASKGSTGFDNRSFDNFLFDVNPTTELRVILETIRDELLTGTLRKEYNQLFIASLRYILNEQKNPDWFFKTSFVKIKHYAGGLTQDLTYNANNLNSYISYVNEVKPYKSVIREFISQYRTTEETNTSVTDFDLPPYYNTVSEKIEPTDVFVTEGIAIYSDDIVEEYPRRHWLDNVGHSVKEIKIVDGGSLYRTAPKVEILGGFGEGATAEAFIGYGSVTKIIVTNPGKGYTGRPEIRIQAPGNSAGTTAVAVPVLGSAVVRSLDTVIKFDRNSVVNLYQADTLAETETLIGDGGSVEYTLKWPINLDLNKINITVDGEEIFASQYDIANVVDTKKSYTRHIGHITFANAPAKDSVITVDYTKNISILNAVDRIKFAYSPDAEMFGISQNEDGTNNYSQLMEGVDYGGVEVKSFDFVTSSGWDTEGWFDDIWDNAEEPEEEVVTLDGSTSIIILNNPLEDGVEYNIYRVSYKINNAGIEEIYSNERLDDPNFNTPQQKNLNAVCQSIIGDGETQIVNLGELNITINPQPEESKVTVVVRKSTSDGAITPDRNVYDADIDGGRLDYGNAKGVRAEEIIIDGDGFVTPFNAGGVEELVPGQILDTLDMQVTTKGNDSTEIRYRLFKDILNRTVYKRIDSAATVLKEDLGQDDLNILVENGEALPEPNRDLNIPGVIWIGKERIEYLVKEDNKLRQIRRGTLGTGVADVHTAGSEVYDQSSGKNIPYADVEQIQTASNVTEFALNFLPNNANEFEVFVNGIRLNGNTVPTYDPTRDQDSPEGDIPEVELLADYQINYVELSISDFIILNTLVITTSSSHNLSNNEVISLKDNSGNVQTFYVKVIDDRSVELYRNADLTLTVTDLSALNFLPDGSIITSRIKVVITNPAILEFENKNIAVVRKQGGLFQKLGESLTDTETTIGFFLRSGN